MPKLGLKTRGIKILILSKSGLAFVVDKQIPEYYIFKYSIICLNA